MRLEQKKRILKKVGFNKERFAIELEQAMKKLDRGDRSDLMNWVKMEFGVKHPNIIDRIINKASTDIRLGI